MDEVPNYVKIEDVGGAEESTINTRFTKAQLSKIDNLIKLGIEKKFEKAIFDPSTAIIKMIEAEVRVAIKNTDLYSYINSIAKQYLEDNLKNIIEMVVEKHIQLTNLRLEQKLEITKKLCYSIDAEIKHTLMRTPISYESDKKIKELIMLELGKIINKPEVKQLEGQDEN